MSKFNLGIQIVEDTPERMVVRVNPLMAYIIYALLLFFLVCILCYTLALVTSHVTDISAYLPHLWLFCLLPVFILHFRKINAAVIDRRQGVVTIKGSLPLLIIRKPASYPLEMVEELRYVGPALHNMRCLCFVFSDGRVIPFQENERRYPLSEDVRRRHERIAEYLGVPYTSQ